MPEVTAGPRQQVQAAPNCQSTHQRGAFPGQHDHHLQEHFRLLGKGEKDQVFDVGVEPSCLQSGSQEHPQAVVALCAVATTRGNPGMVAVTVRHSVAHRARGVTQSHLEPQPQADHNLAERPSGMQSKAGDGGECNHASAPGCCCSWKCARKASRLGPAAVKREEAGSRPGLLLCTAWRVTRTLEAYRAGAWMQAWRSPSPCNFCQGGEAKPSQTVAQCTQLPRNFPQQSPSKLTG